MAAGQAGAFARQLPLRAAMGTFIQNTLQTVRPEAVGDLNAVFSLPAELVEGKGFVQPVGQLLDGFLLQILPTFAETGTLLRTCNSLYNGLRLKAPKVSIITTGTSSFFSSTPIFRGSAVQVPSKE